MRNGFRNHPQWFGSPGGLAPGPPLPAAADSGHHAHGLAPEARRRGAQDVPPPDARTERAGRVLFWGRPGGFLGVKTCFWGEDIFFGGN